MTQQQRAEAFTALHKKGEPLVLYNIWDAGTAKRLPMLALRPLPRELVCRGCPWVSGWRGDPA